MRRNARYGYRFESVRYEVELKSPAAHSRILRNKLAPHFGRFSSRPSNTFLLVESVVDDTCKLDMSKITVTVPQVLGSAW
jgi:hypothetical protein